MRYRSRSWRSVAVVAGLLAALSVQAQTGEKNLRVGILSSGVLENRSPLDAAFVQGLHEQGYIEGRNLVIERRYSSSKLADNAKELAAMKLDAVVTTCTPSTRMMKEASGSTPIVMIAVSDPVRQGVIASLAKPGQNVTGTSSQAEDLLPKRLEQVAAVVPKAGRIAVLVNGTNPVHALGWQKLEAAARDMNIELLKLELRKSDDLGAALEVASRSQSAALFVMPDDSMMFNLRPQIVELAAKYRIPDFYWAREFVESGGLMSYGESLRGSYRASASYVDKIKKGAHPGDLPVEQPTRFELVINAKTAKELGIVVPQSLLLRADEVIQ